MNINILAFDRASARTIDADGRLHVAVTHISKANVCPYAGKEIPGWQELGLDPERIYNLYRDPEELAKGASTFNNLPVLRRHIAVSADEPQKEDVVGSIGSDVAFNAPYLDASICIWDSEAIAAIESGQLEQLSSAYRYTPVMEAGESPDGEAFDGRMTNIMGNHLALVEVGRAGPDVVVADSNPFATKQETPAMKKTALGRALVAALSAASPKIAQDSALPELVGGAKKAGFDKAKVKTALCAMDADMDAERLDEIIDAILGVEQNPEPEEPMAPSANDENDNGAPSKHAEIIDYLRSAGVAPDVLEGVGNMLTRMEGPEANDEEPEGYMKEEDVSKAMDGLRGDLLKQFRDLEKAKSDVRSVVGDVIGMDSADDVFRFALDHLKVDHEGVSGVALAKLFKASSAMPAAPTPKFAVDSATVAAIPGLDRIRQG